MRAGASPSHPLHPRPRSCHQATEPRFRWAGWQAKAAWADKPTCPPRRGERGPGCLSAGFGSSFRLGGCSPLGKATRWYSHSLSQTNCAGWESVLLSRTPLRHSPSPSQLQQHQGNSSQDIAVEKQTKEHTRKSVPQRDQAPSRVQDSQTHVLLYPVQSQRVNSSPTDPDRHPSGSDHWKLALLILWPNPSSLTHSQAKCLCSPRMLAVARQVIYWGEAHGWVRNQLLISSTSDAETGQKACSSS